jgi:hypothetical protein
MVHAERGGVFVGVELLLDVPLVDVRVGGAASPLRPQLPERCERGGERRAERGAWHEAGEALRLPLAQALVIDEEEGALRHDGSTEVDAELVQPEGRQVAARAERARVERIVADEVVDGPAEIVRAGLRDQLDLPAGAGA